MLNYDHIRLLILLLRRRIASASPRPLFIFFIYWSFVSGFILQHFAFLEGSRKQEGIKTEPNHCPTTGGSENYVTLEIVCILVPY
jgi:hypothetical protein